MKHFAVLAVAFSCGIALAPLACPAQLTERPEILVLGTFHMANPGHDVHNMQIDDVLSPKRQKEMEEVVKVLGRFHPTKIAIESSGSDRVKQYSDYLSGRYTLSSNEIDQLGFRLAKELGHQTVYPVDEYGEFPWLRVVNYAKANGMTREFDELDGAETTRMKSTNDFISSHTVLESLELLNSDSSAAAITMLAAVIGRMEC